MSYGFSIDTSILHEDILNSSRGVYRINTVPVRETRENKGMSWLDNIDTIAYTPNNYISIEREFYISQWFDVRYIVGNGSAMLLSTGELTDRKTTYGAEVYNNVNSKILTTDWASVVQRGTIIVISPWMDATVVSSSGNERILWRRAVPAASAVISLGSTYTQIDTTTPYNQPRVYYKHYKSPEWYKEVRRRISTDSNVYENGRAFLRYADGYLEYGFTVTGTYTFVPAQNNPNDPTNENNNLEVTTKSLRFMIINSNIL